VISAGFQKVMSFPEEEMGEVCCGLELCPHSPRNWGRWSRERHGGGGEEQSSYGEKPVGARCVQDLCSILEGPPCLQGGGPGGERALGACGGQQSPSTMNQALSILRSYTMWRNPARLLVTSSTVASTSFLQKP
jgi:hypothetical protein